MVSERSQRIEYAIRDVVLPARELERKGYEILKLNIGDPLKFDFETPSHMIEALYEAAKSGHNGYAESEGLEELRRAICEREKRKNNVDVLPENVLVTTGVTEAIHMVFGAALNPGDEVLIPGPCYPPYISSALFFDAKPVEYRTIEEEGWIPDLEDIEKKISKKTKAFVLINPNNPCGALYSKKIISEICDLIQENNMFLISDEIYDEICYEKKHVSPSFSDVPMIVFNGISKVYLTPGWRIGWCVFLNIDKNLEEVMDGVLRQARARLSANSLAQYGALEALRGPENHIKEMVEKLKKRRDFSYKRLSEIEGIQTQKPEGAFYIFPKIPYPDKEFVLEFLKKWHVLLVFGSGFSKEYGKNHFRAVFLPPIEILEEAFERLEKFMKTFSL